MRLARIGEPGRERPAVLAADGALLDATQVVGDYDAAFWDSGAAALRTALDERPLNPIDGPYRFGPPVPRPGKGKSCETFNPLVPFLLTADEIGDPQALGIRLWVNGELRQNGSTANMIFGVADLIRTVSQFMVLRPGDLINTGTPAGVALGKPDPKPYLRPGDVVKLEIDGLGRQRQTLGQA